MNPIDKLENNKISRKTEMSLKLVILTKCTRFEGFKTTR